MMMIRAQNFCREEIYLYLAEVVLVSSIPSDEGLAPIKTKNEVPNHNYYYYDA